MSNVQNSYCLVLLETSGNQNFIFSTNRLRENVGASQLTYQAGTKWIIDAVATYNNNFQNLQESIDANFLRELLLDNDKGKTYNFPIEENNNSEVEILTAASGKALLITKNDEIAKNIISNVTRRALMEAPGLNISGVYEPIKNWEQDNSLAKAIAKVHQTFEKQRARLPSPDNRFLRLPIIADCAESGFPASSVDSSIPNEEPTRISKVSEVKRKAANSGINRLQKIIKHHGSSRKLIQNINKLEKVFDPDELPWLAVVHADGNGLGQIFQNFQKYIGDQKSNRNYIEKYRNFSLTLDQCTEVAFTEAIKVFPSEKDGTTPVVPLIIGGDDLTVVCHGQYALEFTRTFLQEFEKQTAKHDKIKGIAHKAFGVNWLSACAGISVIKRHFPFSVAYELAESLIKSAKEVKHQVICSDNKTPFPCSAIDFHILYDTSGIELDQIRETLQPDAQTQLYNRPYVVTPIQHLDGAAKGQEWAKQHQWHHLRDRVTALNHKILSNTQSHALRTALLNGQGDAQYQLILQRFPKNKNYKIDDYFSEDQQSLFHKTSDGTFATSFLDALDAMEFFKPTAKSENKEDGETT